MSINKFVASLVLAGILGATAAVAEDSAWFVGGQLGQSSVTQRWTVATGRNTSTYIDTDTSRSGIRYGILAGRKSFFT